MTTELHSQIPEFLPQPSFIKKKRFYFVFNYVYLSWCAPMSEGAREGQKKIWGPLGLGVMGNFDPLDVEPN